MPKTIKCPQCKEKLKYLRIELVKKHFGDICVEDGYVDWDDICGEEIVSEKYFCSDCMTELENVKI